MQVFSSDYIFQLDGLIRVGNSIHPNSVMVTGYDISFFWVIRCEAMGEPPFEYVFYMDSFRDEQGRKMKGSSFGNGIFLEAVAPIAVGADALRFMPSPYARYYTW